MINREMLELAAKAIGGQFDHGTDCITMDGVEYSRWNPYEDTGDALCLAAKLGMRVDFCYEPTIANGNNVAVWLKGDFSLIPHFWQGHFDAIRNARMTITRAAAYIGKSMP